MLSFLVFVLVLWLLGPLLLYAGWELLKVVVGVGAMMVVMVLCFGLLFTVASWLGFKF